MMFKWLQDIWFSVIFRVISLFFVFCIIGLLIVVFLNEMQWRSEHTPAEYPLSYIVDFVEKAEQQDDPVGYALEVIDYVKFHVRVETADGTFFSDDHIPALATMTQVDIIDANTAFYQSRRGVNYLVILRGDRAYIFSHEFKVRLSGLYQAIAHAAPYILGVFSILGCVIFYNFFRPLKWISAGAKRIGAGDLDYRIPNKRSNEFGQVVVVINQMAQDLKIIFESKRQLLFALSHELRSPLTRMKLNIAMLEDNEHSVRLDSAVNDMSDIVEKLLEAEALQGRHKVLNRESAYVSEIILDAVREFNHEAITLSLLESDEQEAPVELDIARIYFVVRNLLKNSIEYSHAEHRMIKVTLHQTQAQVQITIADNGIGIEPENVAHIFTAFYRGQNAIDGKSDGAGLGLYLCQEIIHAHGGSISVTSSVGEGSVFHVALPIN